MFHAALDPVRDAGRPDSKSLQEEKKSKEFYHSPFGRKSSLQRGTD